MADNDSREVFPLPVDLIKSETMRTIAKDLGVSPSGKKEELLARMRDKAATGWDVSPPKRKATTMEGVLKRPKAAKPVQRMESVELTPSRRATRSTANSTPVGRRGISKSVVVRKTPVGRKPPTKTKKEEPAEVDGLVGGSSTSHADQTKHFLQGGTTEMYITSDDLLSLVGEIPAISYVTLWQPSESFSNRGVPSAERVDYWLIPAHEDEKVRKVEDFKETHEKLLQEEKAKREKRGTEKDGDDEESWFKISLSRDIAEGGMGVKLVKGTVESSSIAPVKDSQEEEGDFWVSLLVLAGKKDKSELVHISNGL